MNHPSSTQRFLNAIQFKKPDQTPIWTPHFENELVEKWQDWKGNKNIHPRNYYRNDTAILIGNETFFPSQIGFLRKEGEYDISNNGWGSIVRSRVGSYFTEEIDRFLKEPGDLDQLVFEPASLPSRYTHLESQIYEAVKEKRCMLTKIGGIYVRSHFMRGEDHLLMDMASDEVFSKELFERVAEHLTQMALETLKRTKTHETGLFIYDDMAGMNGPMFSPSMYERYFMPLYQKLILQCRKAGCQHFFMHSDGNILPLLDLLIETGFDGVNPIEPRCCGSLVDIRKKYGNKICLIGGLCNTQILPRNHPKEIEEHLRPLWESAQEGGIVLGAASLPAEMPPQAYDHAMNLLNLWDGVQ